MGNSRGWHKCDKVRPDGTEEVVTACSSQDITRAAQYVAESDAWYLTRSNKQIWPILWKPMPDHPIGAD